MYWRDFVSRSRTTQIFLYAGDFAPRPRLLDRIELADDDAPLRRITLDADGFAAAHEIPAAERIDRRLHVSGVVAQKHFHVAGDVDLGDDVGLGGSVGHHSRDHGTERDAGDGRNDDGVIDVHDDLPNSFRRWEDHSASLDGLS